MNKFKGQIEYAPIPLRIKDAREYCRFSMVELADKIDKTRQAISQFENGQTKPTPDVLSKIAVATNFPIEYFLSLFILRVPLCHKFHYTVDLHQKRIL